MSTTEQKREVYQLRKESVEQRANNLYKNAKQRAKRKNMYFDLTYEQVLAMWPEDNLCPALGIPLEYTGLNNNASLDRLDSSQGYTEDNCAVISWRANRIKNNATLAELRLLVAFMETN